MRLFEKYIILLAVFVLTSCHAARRLKMENKSGDMAEIIWVLKKDSLTQSKLFVSNSDTVRFSLHNRAPHNKLKMTMGVGSWTPSILTNFADDLKSVLIKWNSGFIKLDSTTQIVDFLSLRRRGMDNSQINIVVK